MFSKLRPLLFKVDPEKAHTLAIKSLKFNLIPNVFDEHKNDSIFQTKIFGKDCDFCDKKDECIVTSDMKFITDDEFRRLFTSKINKNS